MRKTSIAVALLLAGGSAWVGLARAEKPPMVTPAQPVALDDEIPEIQHLRAARKSLAEAKDAFEKDRKDKADHRQEILDGIDKATKAIDDEIDELKGK